MRSQPFSQVADGLVMQGFDRSDRDIHGLRYFMVRTFLVVLHDENRFLPVGQATDASGELPAHIRRPLNAVSVIPGRIELLDTSVRLKSLCFPAVFPVSVDGQVSGDLEKPILEIAARTKHVDFPEHPEKSFLHNVQRVLPVSDNRKGQDENSLLEKPGYGHESLTVSFPDFFDKPGKLFIRPGLMIGPIHERRPYSIPLFRRILRSGCSISCLSPSSTDGVRIRFTPKNFFFRSVRGTGVPPRPESAGKEKKKGGV
jgi:hypothetical protein